MSAEGVNENGVPQYAKGHAGRLLVTMAAIDKLDRATAPTVANLTGLSKGKIDEYVKILNDQFGARIVKAGPVYTIEDWGLFLKRAGVKKALTMPINGTKVPTSDSQEAT